MASNKKVATIVGVGAGVGLMLLLTRKSGAQEEETEEAPKAPKPLSEKQKAAALALRYSRLFGVPPSLVIALMAVGGWKPKAYVKNSRGGSWGYTYMTLATAQDLTRRFPAIAAKYWPRFKANPTGETLQDPTENIALGTYHMSLQWKRFKDWYTAALSYYTGAGRMDGLVKQGGGKLPVSLPADVAKIKASYDRVRASDPYVKKALSSLDAKSKTSGIGSNLVVNPTTGRPVGGDRVVALMAGITDAKKGREALDFAKATLKRAWDRIPSIPYVPALAGLRAAHRSRVEQNRAWVEKVEKEVPTSGAISDATKQKIALALVQSEDTLKDVDGAITDPNLRFWPSFYEGMRRILGAAASAMKDAVDTVASGLGPGILIPVGLAVGTGFFLLTRK